MLKWEQERNVFLRKQKEKLEASYFVKWRQQKSLVEGREGRMEKGGTKE